MVSFTLRFVLTGLYDSRNSEGGSVAVVRIEKGGT